MCQLLDVSVARRADTHGLAGAHLLTPEAELRGINNSERPAIVEAVTRNMHLHPMYLSYLGPAGPLQPRRMSDVIDELTWPSHPVFAQLFVPLGASRQLTIVTAPVTGADWHAGRSIDHQSTSPRPGWRTRSRLQAALVAFDRRTCLAHPSPPSDSRSLTSRETKVLQMIARGLTVVDVAGIQRISSRKLGVHDRLRAVSLASDAGILHM